MMIWKIFSWEMMQHSKDHNPVPFTLSTGCSVSPNSHFLSERERCIHLCTEIHTELRQELLEVVSPSIWIHKEKFSVVSLVHYAICNMLCFASKFESQLQFFLNFANQLSMTWSTDWTAEESYRKPVPWKNRRCLKWRISLKSMAFQFLGVRFRSCYTESMTIHPIQCMTPRLIFYIKRRGTIDEVFDQCHHQRRTTWMKNSRPPRHL